MIKTIIEKRKTKLREKAYNKEFGPRYDVDCIIEDSRVKVEFTKTVRAFNEQEAREKALEGIDAQTKILNVNKVD